MKKIRTVLSVAIIVVAMSAASIAPAVNAGIISDETTNDFSTSSSSTFDGGAGRGFTFLRFAGSSQMSRMLLRIALVG